MYRSLLLVMVGLLAGPAGAEEPGLRRSSLMLFDMFWVVWESESADIRALEPIHREFRRRCPKRRERPCRAVSEAVLFYAARARKSQTTGLADARRAFRGRVSNESPRFRAAVAVPLPTPGQVERRCPRLKPAQCRVLKLDAFCRKVVLRAFQRLWRAVDRHTGSNEASGRLARRGPRRVWAKRRRACDTARCRREVDVEFYGE